MDLEKLKGKIASKEEWDKLGAFASPGVPTPFGRHAVWWRDRERLRLEQGIYKTTDVLDRVNDDLGFPYAHISSADPDQVAYTPDATHGFADRQVRTTVGRLLAKYYPTIADHIIQGLVAEHSADLSSHVEWIEGPGIAEVYSKVAVNSCMTNKHWTYGDPTQVYDAPNIKLAVLRDKDGNINSRCLCYIPSEDDKRYIRCYGDEKLRKRLIRLGFKYGSFIGATLKKIPIKRVDNGFVMPYLDANGAGGGRDGSAVALMDGEIRVISSDAYTAISSQYPSSAGIATNTSGYICLKNVSSDAFNLIDGITGEKINSLVQRFSRILVDGKTGVSAAVPENWVAARYVPPSGASTEILSVSPETPTFPYCGSLWVDSSHARKECGFSLLDPNLYGPQKYTRYGAVNTEDGRRILMSDAATVITVNRATTYIHSSEVKKDMIKLHARSKDEKLYAEAGSKVLKTTTGRKVIPGIHDVIALYNGDVVFSRGVKTIRYFGRAYSYKSERPSDDFICGELLKRLQDGADVVTMMGYGTSYVYIDSYNASPSQHYRRGTSVEKILDAMSLHGDQASKLLHKVWGIFMAEARAVEYPSPMPLVEVAAEQQPEELELV